MASYVITQEMARNAANCLVKKKFEQIEEKLTKKEYEFGEFLARKYFSDVVLQVVSLYAEYVGFYSSFYVKHENLPSIRIDTSLKLPTHKNLVLINIDEYRAVREIRNEWKKLKDKESDTKTYLTNEILKLRTYKRVKEQAPELLPFLPEAKEEKKLPSVNYGNLRSFVKSIVETK